MGGYYLIFAWKDKDEVPDGHKMVRVPFLPMYCCPDIPFQTFKGVLNGVCHNLVLRMVLSDRILSLWEQGREIKTGFEELKVWRRNSSVPFALDTYPLHRYIWVR